MSCAETSGGSVVVVGNGADLKGVGRAGAGFGSWGILSGFPLAVKLVKLTNGGEEAVQRSTGSRITQICSGMKGFRPLTHRDHLEVLLSWVRNISQSTETKYLSMIPFALSAWLTAEPVTLPRWRPFMSIHIRLPPEVRSDRKEPWWILTWRARSSAAMTRTVFEVSSETGATTVNASRIPFNTRSSACENAGKMAVSVRPRMSGFTSLDVYQDR